ncbi:MAG: oligosaccharide flippase family protein [Chloroflexi bacterium]|nr:oligosaccharide flippase family protein [Chloroflexota bacterium]
MSNETFAPGAETPLAFRAVRGGLWVALSSYFNVVFGFVANLALTRILAPEDFGIFALATFFFALVNVRPKIGIGYAFGQRQETTGELVGTHLALDVSAGFLTLMLAAVAVPVLRALGYSWEIAWVLLALGAIGILDSIMGTAWVLLDKDWHFGHTSLVSSIVFPVTYVPAFWLALNGGGYWSLVAQAAAYAGLLLVGMWWVARRRLKHVWQLRWRFDLRVARGLVGFGGLVGLAGLAAMFIGQFDNFLVGTFVGVAALGYYDRAYRIGQWPNMLVTTVLSRTAFYTYARLQDDAARLQKTLTMSLWLIANLALLQAVAIFVAAPDLVVWLYGERWAPSALFLRFLVLYSVLRPILDNAGSFLMGVGKPRTAVTVAGLQTALLVILGIPLTLQFGVLGTCVAVGITLLAALAVSYRYVAREIAVQVKVTVGPAVVAAGLAVVAYFVLLRVVDFDGWPLIVRVLAKLAFAACIYCAALFAMQPRGVVERMTYIWRLARGNRAAMAH